MRARTTDAELLYGETGEYIIDECTGCRALDDHEARTRRKQLNTTQRSARTSTALGRAKARRAKENAASSSRCKEEESSSHHTAGGRGEEYTQNTAEELTKEEQEELIRYMEYELTRNGVPEHWKPEPLHDTTSADAYGAASTLTELTLETQKTAAISLSGLTPESRGMAALPEPWLGSAPHRGPQHEGQVDVLLYEHYATWAHQDKAQLLGTIQGTPATRVDSLQYQERAAYVARHTDQRVMSPADLIRQNKAVQRAL